MADLKQIKKYLEQQKLQYKLVSFSTNKTVKLNEEAYTVSDVVKSGIDLGEVVKTLVVRTNDAYIALALRGNDKVDFKKIRTKFGGKSELAKPEEVLKVVGVPIGAVCPILVGVPLYIDDKVMTLKKVHMGSGDLKHGLEMDLDDLQKAVKELEIISFT